MKSLFISAASFLIAFATTAYTQQASTESREVFRKAEPAVVRIECKGEKEEVLGHGSGFIVTSDGKFLTNYHVIQHAKKLTVYLANDDAYDHVDVVDIDKRKDIALLKIRAVDLPILQLGRSTEMKPGDPVFAIGTPLEDWFKNSFSDGIISGLRALDGYKLLQFTAPVSSGNSGGPLLNRNGEAVGIVQATSKLGQNLNVAVPIDYAKGMLSVTATRSLESIYEPPSIKESESQSEASKTEPEPGKNTASANPSNITPVQVAAAIQQAGLLPFLAKGLYSWEEELVKGLFGTPLRHRYSYDNFKTVDGDIYTYNDPTKNARMIELGFDSKTKKMKSVFVYTNAVTAEQIRKSMGENYLHKKNPDGSYFYMYKDKQVNVFIDKKGNVISIGLY